MSPLKQSGGDMYSLPSKKPLRGCNNFEGFPIITLIYLRAMAKFKVKLISNPKSKKSVSPRDVIIECHHAGEARKIAEAQYGDLYKVVGVFHA